MKISFKKTKPINMTIKDCGCGVLTFTNQNIAEYMEELATNKKSVLCVAASGDYLINTALLGTENITAFDANPRTLYYTELKLMALRTLPRDKFIKFLTSDFLNIEIYKSFKKLLSPQTQEFWDKTYEKLHKNQNRIDHYSTFFSDERGVFCYSHHLRASRNYITGAYSYVSKNIYFKPENYEKAQEAVKNLTVEFLHTDVSALPKEIGNKKFDLALLSNIEGFTKGGHWNGKFDLERFKTFFDTNVKPLTKNCKVIQAAHHWGDVWTEGIYLTKQKPIAEECVQYAQGKGFKNSRLLEFSPESLVDNENPNVDRTSKDAMVIVEK